MTERLKPTPVSDLLFSDANLDALHEAVRYGVFKASGIVVDRQSDVELRLVVRSIYLTYARNAPDGVLEQVRELNARVLADVVPRVAAEAEAHRKFIEGSWASGRMPEPMPRAEIFTRKGERTLDLTPLV